MTHPHSPRRRQRRSHGLRFGVAAGAIGFVAASLVGVAGPATAQSAPASLTFVNAYDIDRFTAVVDDSTPTRQEIDLKELRTLSPIDIAPGDHPVDVYAGESAAGAPVDSRTVTAASGESLAFAVHPDVGGATVTSIFDDDGAKTGSATTRLEVRHVAAAGPVDVELSPASSSTSGTTESFTIANGEQGVISAVVADGVTYQLTVTPVGQPDALITDTSVSATPGVVNTIYIAGNPPTAESSSDPASLVESSRQVGALPPPAVNLVNGFTNESFVFYVDGTQNASIEGLRRNGLLQGLGQGQVSVDAYRASGTPGQGTPSISLDINVCDGRSYDLAVYQDATNSTQLTLFENDVTSPETDTTRFTIRHIGARNALDFVFDGSGENAPPYTRAEFSLANGQEQVIDDAIINDYLVNAYAPGTTTDPVAQNPDLEGEAAATQIAYVMGTPPGVSPPLNQWFPGSGEAVIPDAPAPAGPDNTCGSTSTSTSGGDTSSTGGGNGGPDTGGTPPNGGSNPDTTSPQPAAGDFFTGVAPQRALDTRSGSSGPIEAGGTVVVPVAGEYGVPADATAAVVNIGVAQTAGVGFVSATPDEQTGQPDTSVLTFGSADSTASANATVPLNADGSFALYTSTEAELIADVVGYYSPTTTQIEAGRFVPVTPDRLFDTRTTTAPSGKVLADSTISVTALGQAGLPTTGVQSVVMNLTAAQQTERGFVTAADTDPESLSVSSLNYRPGDGPVANLVVVDVNAGGELSLFAKTDVHLIGDVVGYFTNDDASLSTAGLLQLLEVPERVFDTRNSDTKVAPGAATSPDVVSALGVAPRDVLALSMSVTAVQAEGQTFVAVSPRGDTNTSTLNLPSDERRSNATYTGTADDGTVTVSSSLPVHVIGDAVGYFQTAD